MAALARLLSQPVHTHFALRLLDEIGRVSGRVVPEHLPLPDVGDAA
jgi:hypothetical protein